MNSESHQNKLLNKNKLIFGFFTLTILLFYPLVYPKVFGHFSAYYSHLAVITVPLLSIFCALGTFCFLDIESLKNDFKKYRLIYLIVLLILVICFIGVFFRGYGIFIVQISNFFAGMALITIPFFVRLAASRFSLKKWLCFVVLFFYFTNLIIATVGVAKGRFAYGLPGNTNWQASIAVVLLPIIFWVTYEYFPKRIKDWGGHYIVMAIFTAISIWLEYVSGSKGALLAIAAGIGFYAVGKVGNKFFRSLTIWSSFVTCFLLIIGTIWALKSGVRLIDNDIRSHLWSGAIKLFCNDFNYIFGIPNNAGNGSFESAFSAFNSVQYYLAKIASGRNNHPHNQLLYIFICYGFVGALSIFGLLFYVLKCLYVKFNKLTCFVKMLLISTLMLIAHGMVDLVLYEWPTNILFLIFIGILFNEVFKFKRLHNEYNRRSLFFNALILILLITFGYQFINNFEASSLDRAGRIARDLKQYEKANDFYKQSILKFPKPRVIYDAMNNAFYDLANLELVKDYGEMLNASGVDNFAHNKLLMSVVAIEYKDYKNALLYLNEERLNYPADVMPLLLNYYVCVVILQDKKLYQAAYDDLEMVLSYRIKDKKKLKKIMNYYTTIVKTKNFSPYNFVVSYFRKFK